MMSGVLNSQDTPIVKHDTDSNHLIQNTTSLKTDPQWKISDKLTVHNKKLTKSDCNISLQRVDVLPVYSSENHRRKSRGWMDGCKSHIKRVNSFGNTFKYIIPRSPLRGIPLSFDDVSSKTELQGRPDSYVVSGHISILPHQDRPLTCEEEMNDELGKLRHVIFQMHQKLMNEKHLNKHLMEETKFREKEYKEIVEKMRSIHDQKLNDLRGKAMLLFGKCAKEKADLEEENATNISSWMVERNNFEMRIKELQLEVNKVSSQHNSDTSSKTIVSETTEEKVIKSENTCQDISDNISSQPVLEVDNFHQWDNLYKILYQISINKIVSLESSHSKEAISKTLVDYGYFNLFNDLVSNCIQDKDNDSIPVDSNYLTGNPVVVRRSSSCPFLVEVVNKAGEEIHQIPSTDEPKNTPENLEELKGGGVRMRATSRYIALRPMSIPLSNIDDKNLCQGTFMDTSSDSLSPDRDSSPASVFSRHKLQYRHVCRVPKRAIEGQQKSLPLVSNTSNSLPFGTSTSKMEDCTIPATQSNKDDVKWLNDDNYHVGKNSVLSNFERLCQRRNGLINPDFKSNKISKPRHVNVIDKLGQNLRSYIGHAKEQQGDNS